MVLEVFLAGGEGCILKSSGIFCWSFSEALKWLGEELLLARSLINVHVVLSENSKVLVPRDYYIIGKPAYWSLSWLCQFFKNKTSCSHLLCIQLGIFILWKAILLWSMEFLHPSAGTRQKKKDESLPVLGCMSLPCSNLKHWDSSMCLVTYSDGLRCVG